jgi:hypothetical protein
MQESIQEKHLRLNKDLKTLQEQLIYDPENPGRYSEVLQSMTEVTAEIVALTSEEPTQTNHTAVADRQEEIRWIAQRARNGLR